MLAAVAEIIKSTINWKPAGVDNIENFWFKNVNCLYDALEAQSIEILKHPEATRALTTAYIDM